MIVLLLSFFDLEPIRITRKCDKIGGMNKQEGKKRERERTPNNRTTTGFRISDELWDVLQPLLPVHVNTHRGWREDAHGYLIAPVPMPFSMSCARVLSGKPSIRPSCVRTRPPMTAFKSGCKQESSSSCGKQDSSSLRRPVGSTGTGFRWMGR